MWQVRKYKDIINRLQNIYNNGYQLVIFMIIRKTVKEDKINY